MIARHRSRETLVRMPFTVSHAAAVLPLHALSKSRLPLSALMIGSMSPDFSYFVPQYAGVPTHSIAGLFWFCWPAGLAAWLLFVCVLQRPTIALLPRAWQPSISPTAAKITVSALALASVSILMGAATHVLWDSFTHARTPVVDAIPQLRTMVQVGPATIRLSNLLQHVSTIFGLAVLAFWSMSRLRRRATASDAVHRPPHHLSNAARVGAAVRVLASSSAAAFANYAPYSHVRLESRLYHFAIGGMAGWAVAWTLIALAITWKWRTARARD